MLLADSLVNDYDILDVFDHLVTTCVTLLDVSAAGMLLDDLAGGVAVAAASSDEMRVVEAFQSQHREGPCRDCVTSGTKVYSSDLESEDRWPHFVPVAVGAGYRAVTALPLRLRGQVIGSLGLFALRPGTLEEADERLAQAFADVATIGLLHHRNERRISRLAEQLQAALDSRVLVEQAKGVVAERHNATMEQAYQRLRRYARDRNLKLTQVASAVVAGRLTL